MVAVRDEALHSCSTRKIVDGKSVYNTRHKGGHCKAKQIPFGAFVDYLPTPSPKELKRSKELGDRTRNGLLGLLNLVAWVCFWVHLSLSEKPKNLFLASQQILSESSSSLIQTGGG